MAATLVNGKVPIAQIDTAGIASSTDITNAIAQKIVVSPTNPNLTTPGLWIQTGLGPGGANMTFWVETGS